MQIIIKGDFKLLLKSNPNTPVCYDDQVSLKMGLLGKKGYYDPG